MKANERPRVDYVLGLVDMTDKISFLQIKSLLTTNIFTADYFFGRVGVVVTNCTFHTSRDSLYLFCERCIFRSR